jgi:hypothetical protein
MEAPAPPHRGSRLVFNRIVVLAVVLLLIVVFQASVTRPILYAIGVFIFTPSGMAHYRRSGICRARRFNAVLPFVTIRLVFRWPSTALGPCVLSW